MDNIDKLLKEYALLLAEDDGGGGDFGGYGGDYGGYGGGVPNGTWGYMDYGGPLADIFIKPFTNVFNVAKAGVKEIGIRVKTMLKVVLETALTTIMPWVQSNYKKIFDDQRAELDKFKKENEQLFKDNLSGFTNDAKLIAFMINPGIYLTAGLIKKSPGAAVKLVDTVKDTQAAWSQEWEDIKHRIAGHNKKRIYSQTPTWKEDWVSAHESKKISGKSLTEQPVQQQIKQTPENILLSFLRRPDVINSIEGSAMSKSLKAEGEKVLNNISNNLLKNINTALNVKTVQDVERLTGKRLSDQFAKLKPEEKQAAETAMVAQVKAAIKTFYIKSLTAEIENVKRDGVNPNNVYLVKLQGILQRVKTL